MACRTWASKHFCSGASAAFGLVALNVIEGRWTHEINAAIDLLCETFVNQQDSALEIQYLQSFKVILGYTIEEPRIESRQPIRKKIMSAVDKRSSLGFGDSTLKEEYKRIHAQYGDR